MGRSSFMTLLMIRPIVKGLLELSGYAGFLAGLVCLIYFLMGGGLSFGFYGVVGFIVYWVSFWLSFEYDTAVLSRAPAGQSIHLIH